MIPQERFDVILRVLGTEYGGLRSMDSGLVRYEQKNINAIYINGLSFSRMIKEEVGMLLGVFFPKATR